MENHHFIGKINYKWTNFNSYVKLPEGTDFQTMLGLRFQWPPNGPEKKASDDAGAAH